MSDLSLPTADTIAELESQALSDVANAPGLPELDAVRVGALGKKGNLSQLMKSLGKMTPEQRQEMGPVMNGAKERVAEAVAARKEALESEALEAQLAAETLDVSLPAAPELQGSIHPISRVMDEVIEIFASLGFSVAEGPDIEDDFYNFTALNIPPEHPARQMHDTFYFPPDDQGERKVLRTHTSPVQIRAMKTNRPPIRVISPGRTYRCDSDATHTPMFHQFEALVIDKETHMGHLKWTLEAFLKAFFEVDELPMRFRPSYFPFTEPSAELDIGCSREGGQTKIGAGEGWLEILGCGMVNPHVLEAVELDPSVYQGFAFGCGIDRLAMLKYGMPDLRDFFAADLRWLRHYGFSSLRPVSLSGGVGQ